MVRVAAASERGQRLPLYAAASLGMVSSAVPLVEAVTFTLLRVLLIVTLLLACAVLASGQGKGYNLVSGRLEAENGGIECYFSVAAGEDAMGLAAHPKGIPCVRLKEFAGKTGTLFWIPD